MRLLAALLGSVLALPAAAQTERRYDEAGRYTGRAERRSGTVRLYDGHGRYGGRVEKR